MKTIWKYPLVEEPEQTIEMPEGANILSVQCLANLPMLWAMVDTDKKKTKRLIEVYPTGVEIEDKPAILRKYIGTYQRRYLDPKHQDKGITLVWHVFEYKGI